MHRFEGSSTFMLIFSATLLACRDPGDPGIDEVDDGIEVGLETSTAEESTEAEEDEGMTVKFDEPNEGSDDAATAEGGNLDAGCEKVDLLFVIDNSGSMQDEQNSLVSSFPDFIDEMQLQLADTESYHIGVISTDAYEFNDGCEEEGAMIIATGGDGSSDDDCGPFEAGYSYMTEEDDLDETFSCAAQIGTDGSGDERGMQTMQAALSKSMNEPGGCNDGFLRDDALLVIVLITDEEDDHEVEGCNQTAQDGSEGEPPDWYAGVTAAKGGVEEYVVVLSLIGPPGPDPLICPELDKCQSGVEGAEISHRITEFTNMFTYGFLGRVCEPSYASFFEEAVAVIKGACDEFEPIG